MSVRNMSRPGWISQQNHTIHLIACLIFTVVSLPCWATPAPGLTPRPMEQGPSPAPQPPAIMEESLSREARLVLDDHSQARMAIPEAFDADGRMSLYTPVVFWHGMGDTAYGSINIERLALQRQLPNITVFSIQIGNDSKQDMLGSYSVNVNRQIETACQAIITNPIIKAHGVFNAVGFSQGAQFMRGLIQRCPLRSHGIRPKNFISLGGQHQGVFGLPRCSGDRLCEQVRKLITRAAYESWIQDHVVQAEYWHDPYNEDVYRAKSVFLADINNENQFNKTYKANLGALEHMVLVEFLQDEMVVPRESSLFGFYKPGQDKEIVPLEQSALYLDDRLGLRKMLESGRLRFMSATGKHLQYSMNWFLTRIAIPFLKN